PRGWAYLAAYLLVVLLWATMATALAVLTRSVAVSVAAPITWMLLIEQLASMVPMLEAITPWLPFNASHMLLAQALGEAPRSEEHTSELQSRFDLVCRRLLAKKTSHVTELGGWPEPSATPTRWRRSGCWSTRSSFSSSWSRERGGSRPRRRRRWRWREYARRA